MKAAFFDVGGTLIEVWVWNGIIEYFKHKDKRPITHYLFWALHMPLYLLRKLGLVSQTRFRAAWADHLSWYWRGYDLEQAGVLWDWVVGEYLAGHWRTETRQRLEQHKAAGDLVVLVSAGPKGLIQRIADEVGADHAVATQHKLRDGCYVGGAEGPVCIGENKIKLTKALLDSLGQAVDYASSYMYGDSPGDLDLFELVGHPVAVHPDEELLPIAHGRGWEVLAEG